MKSIKTRLTILFTLFCCLGILSQPLFAGESRVYDQASLFTSSEIQSLEDAISTLVATYQMDIVIVTTDDAQGATSQDYADDFYDYNGFGIGEDKDGLLLLIDMDNRNVYISTTGLAIRHLTDARINALLDNVTPYLSDGDFYRASTTFLRKVEGYFKAGIPSNQYNQDEYNNIDPYEPTKREPFKNNSGEYPSGSSLALSIGASLIGAFLIAFITRAIIMYTYKHPRFTTPETKPLRNSVHYTERIDQFITSHTTSVKIQSSNNSGGGRSSTHHSSSGRSHGGGGRGF